MNPLTVALGETGVVRLFTLTIEAGGLQALQAPGALDIALGVENIDPEQVELFATTDLAGVGLATYLIDGCGIPETAIAPDAARLDALDGDVMVVLSRAFGGRAVTLRPAAQLSLAGIWSQTPTDWRDCGPIVTASASTSGGMSGLSPRAARSRARRIGGAIFAVVMAIIAAIILMVVLRT